ncbi:tetratricopeptide repeat protein [Paraflavitalea speifideaquila]|uniref:tetratricopeptide repeat protein n=1 Tax=Paraflavitalea speifideaquila TaxID=3076558 RepID=UPI0028EC4891|nr:tetratricopeptide repeat protein [Paraflavitalea speifideiaquila]
MLALEEALQIGENLHDLRILAVVQQNLAGAALKQRNFPLTRKYAAESLALYRQLGSTDGETTSLRSLATCYLQEGKLTIAKEYAHQALALSRTWHYKVEEVSIYRILMAIAYAEKNYANGLQYEDTMVNRLEGMVKEVISQQSADLEKKYETGKKRAASNNWRLKK